MSLRYVFTAVKQANLKAKTLSKVVEIFGILATAVKQDILVDTELTFVTE